MRMYTIWPLIMAIMINGHIVYINIYKYRDDLYYKYQNVSERIKCIIKKNTGSSKNATLDPISGIKGGY